MTTSNLQGCGTPKEREAFLEHLRARLGKMTLDLNKFTHAGIEHDQDPKTYAITLSQVKYTAQLRTICLDAVVTSGWDTDAPPDLHSAFRTLVGGVAWHTLTAPAISVYVAFLQKTACEADVGQHQRLEQAGAWVQKRPQRICFEALTPPMRLVCVTDLAFQAQATDGLAMRGCLLLLAGCG